MGFAAALMLAGTAVSVMGQSQAAQADAEQAQQSVDTLQYQRAQAEADADAEVGSARVAADKIRKAARAQQATSRAQLAASGVDVGYGTSSLINDTIKKESEEDALTTILDGENRAKRLRAQGIGYGIEASNVAKSAKKSAKASQIGMVGSVLSGGYSVASGWKTSGGGASGGGTGMVGGGSFSG